MTQLSRIVRNTLNFLSNALKNILSLVTHYTILLAYIFCFITQIWNFFQPTCPLIWINSKSSMSSLHENTTAFLHYFTLFQFLLLSVSSLFFSSSVMACFPRLEPTL